MSRETFLIIVAALMAGAIGFGIAISTVPLDEIVQFRALINAGLGALSINNHLDSGSTKVKDPTRMSPKASTERESRSGGDSICNPNITNCEGMSPSSTTSRSDVPNRDGAEGIDLPDKTSSAPQFSAPEGEAGTLGSLPPNAGSRKAHVGPGGHSRRLVKKGKM